jgi:hypothetical protein
MGLITGLLTLPLAPVRGVVWLGEVLEEEARRQIEEQTSPERRLAELDVLRTTGEISDEEAEAIEAEIVQDMLEREAR